MQTFNIIPPNPWVDPNGNPTLSFFQLISQIAQAAGATGVPAGTIQSNITAGVALSVPNSLGAVLDALIGSARGDLVYRKSTGWGALALGAGGDALVSNGTDLVFSAIVDSLTGGSGILVSGSTGAISLSLSSTITLAAGTPAEITTAGGDLLLTSTTGEIVLGPAGGTTKFGQTSTAATLPTSFSAAKYLAVKDGAGTTLYIPFNTAPW